MSDHLNSPHINLGFKNEDTAKHEKKDREKNFKTGMILRETWRPKTDIWLLMMDSSSNAHLINLEIHIKVKTTEIC